MLAPLIINNLKSSYLKEWKNGIVSCVISVTIALFGYFSKNISEAFKRNNMIPYCHIDASQFDNFSHFFPNWSVTTTALYASTGLSDFVKFQMTSLSLSVCWTFSVRRMLGRFAIRLYLVLVLTTNLYRCFFEDEEGVVAPATTEMKTTTVSYFEKGNRCVNDQFLSSCKDITTKN